MNKYIQKISFAVAFALLFVVFPAKTQAVTNCSVNSYTINGSQTFVQVPAGTSATLAWSTSNCTSVNVLGVTYTGAQANSYSIQTPPINSPQIFTLTANSATSGIPVVVTVTGYPGSAVISNCSINSFTINGSPTIANIPSGTTATLAWTTSNCTKVNVLGVDYTGAQANSYSVTTPPITSVQIFTLTASNSNSTSVNKTVTANPTVVASCAINSFTANGTAGSITIPANTNVNLAWNTSNCTIVTVNGTTYTGNQAWTGNVYTGALTQSVSYTLTAIGTNGIQRISTVNITVTPIASCAINSFTINGSPTFANVTSGSSATLAWSTSNCTSVNVLGVTYTGAQANSYSIQTPPITSVQIFTLTAYNSNSIAINRTVTANPTITQTCAINSFTANGVANNLTVSSNTNVVLSWTTSNCTSVMVNGITYTGNRAWSGSVYTGALTQSVSYTLTATGANGTQVSSTVNINVTQSLVCKITSFTVNGVTNTTIPYNTSVNLVWTTSNCDTITVLGVTYSGTQADAGHVWTSLLTNPVNDFTATANSATAGSDNKSVIVNVTPQQQTNCTITSFTANGATTITIPYNTSVTLAWSTSNCTTVVVNGITYTGGQAISGNVSTGALTSAVNNYTASASNSTGSTDSKSVVVNVSSQPNLCVVNSFTANGSTDFLQIPTNTSVTLAWSTSNCTSLTVNGVSYTGGQIISGTFTTGSLNGSYNYILTAQSGSQYVTRTINVTTFGSNNNNNCQILSFSPAQSTVNYGNSTTLNWTLSGGCQNYVTVSGTNMSSNQIYNGYINTGVINNYSTYTLTAYSTNGSVVTATTYVNVNNNNNYNNNNNNYYYNQNCNINYFTANGYNNSVTVSQGTIATIAWNTNGCNNVTVSGPGVYSQNQYGSIQSAPINGSTSYILTAYDTYYNNPQTRTIYITTTGGGYYQPIYTTTASVAPVTSVATNISTTSARLNGLVVSNTNTNSVSAYFEYGTTSSLGNQTNPQTVSTYTLTNYYDTITTSPNTTYYYRAAVNSNGQILRGDVVSFTTPATQTTPVVINRITYGTGTGSGSVSLSISDQNQIVSPGDSISYVINYKNISSGDLSNVMLNVVLPTGVAYKSSTQGMPTTNNTIVATIGTLTKGSNGSINIQAQADASVKAGTNLVSTATLSFVTPAGSQDSAVAYYLNTVGGANNQSNLGGFALGAGFFPTTLFGWIILIGIIIILIILGRRLTGSNANKQYQGHAPMDPHNLPH